MRPVALVTGGLHRIGAAIAAALAGAGYDLALHARAAGDPDAALLAALATAGARHAVVPVDLGAGGAGARLFDLAAAALGAAPSLIVNNASLFAESSLAELDESDLTRALEVNLVAPVMLTRALVAAGGGGAVVNILDQRVRNPVPDQIGYTLSKQALWQATRTLAIAAAPHVRVNAVAPGLTLPAPDYEPGRMERMAAAMPLERLPAPEGIADAVLYLARAHSVTGQTLFVDGGANLRGFARDFAYL